MRMAALRKEAAASFQHTGVIAVNGRSTKKRSNEPKRPRYQAYECGSSVVHVAHAEAGCAGSEAVNAERARRLIVPTPSC
jgi:hypothetical protein